MNIIFLDIDGVLNCTKFRKDRLLSGDYSVAIEPRLLLLLKQLVVITNSSIVLISSWRKYWIPEGCVDSAGQKIEKALASTGLSILDKTPVLNNGSRSQEVERWLKTKGYVDRYVILDDSDFMWSKTLRMHWVQCSSETGLTVQDVEQAISIMSGNLIQEERQILNGVTYILKKLFNRTNWRE